MQPSKATPKVSVKFAICFTACAVSTLAPFPPATAEPMEQPAAFDDLIQSPLIPSPNQISAHKSWLETYLATQVGAPIKAEPVPEESGFHWSKALLENASSIEDEKERRRTLYELIGQHLTVAEQLQESRFADTRLDGVGLALISSRYAAVKLNDPKLAVAINEAFILPHLQDAPLESWHELSLTALLEHVVQGYGANQETTKQIAAYELWFGHEKARNKQDFIRLQLAYIYDAAKNYDAALKYLYDISARGDLRDARQMIPVIQKKRADEREEKLQEQEERAAEATPVEQ